MKPPTALTVAGSDSGGGAGIAADLATFGAHGVWGLCALTAVTAQNTLGVQAAHTLPPELVVDQIDSVAGDIGVGAAKTGMLGAAPTVHAVVEALTRWRIRPLVVDPVAVSSTGAALVDPAGLAALRVALVPLADLLTPNLAEAAALTGSGPIGDRSAMEAVARDLLRLGAGAVLVKGGHLDGPDAPDLLATSEGGWTWLEGPRVPGRHNHGTGCVLSAAVTARLARGEELGAAVEAAKDFVARAIRVGVELGAGVGAVNPAGPATDA